MNISVICPTYGRISLLEESIFSFLNQNNKNTELIIVNDNKDIELNYSHTNIKILNLRNRFNSLGEKRNFCIKQCSGEIIIPLDDDDIIYSEYIDFCLEKIQGYDWYCPMNNFVFNRDENKMKLSPGIMPNSLIFKRKVWETVKFPEESFDENGIFLRKLYKEKFKGRFSKLPLEDINYVCGFSPLMKNNYHTQLMFRKDNLNYYHEIEKYTERKIKNNELKTGIIDLNPHWKFDYTKLKIDFVNRNQKFFDKK